MRSEEYYYEQWLLERDLEWYRDVQMETGPWYCESCTDAEVNEPGDECHMCHYYNNALPEEKGIVGLHCDVYGGWARTMRLATLLREDGHSAVIVYSNDGSVTLSRAGVECNNSF